MTGLKKNNNIKTATKSQKIENMRRQAYMKAAGYEVPQDGSWGPYQQRIWDSLTVKPKEYNTTLAGLAENLYDRATGNTTQRINPFERGSVLTYNPDNVDWSKTRASQSPIIEALSGSYLPAAAVASLPLLGSAMVTAPIASIVGGGGAAVAGTAINKASESITGRDFGTNVAMYTPLTPGMGELFNPGYVLGGLGAERRMLDAIYNQVTPTGYTNTNFYSNYGGLTKAQEMKRAVNDFFTPKRINTSPKTLPEWIKRLDPEIMPPGHRAQTLFRDDAWRLATRQKPRTITTDGEPHQLYIKNPDGKTYSYDLDYIESARARTGREPLNQEILPLFPGKEGYKEGFNKGHTLDMLTTNGGNIGVDFTLPKDWNTNPARLGPRQIILKEPYRIYDKWDLQPLLDKNASVSPAFTQWLTKHPNKVTKYIRNKDWLEAVGGNPFMLDMQVAPETMFTINHL